MKFLKIDTVIFKKFFYGKYWFGIFLSLIFIYYIERNRILGQPAITPFVLLMFSIVVASAIGGLIPGLISATCVSIYAYRSYLIGYGPETFTGELLNTLIGIIIYYIQAVSLGIVKSKKDNLINKLKMAQSDLHQEINKAQQYLDIAGVILVAIEKNQKISLINQKGCEILEYDVKEIIGKNWFDLFVPESVRKDVLHGFQLLMNGELENVKHFESPILTKNGQERLILWHNALLRDKQGNIVGTLSSGEDITDERIAKEQIINLNHALVNRAVALEEANKELDSFAYSISHDLRAPLRHINGFIELLQKNINVDLDEQSQHYMTVISTSAKLMNELIEVLLSFSRMSNQQILLTTADLEKIVQTVITQLKPNLNNREIEWRISNLPLVTGDPSLLQIVFTNLLSNAIKFTKNREKAIIKISWEDKDNEVIISIQDNGIGFDMNYYSKLFGVFQRLHHKNKFDGIGAGLAITKRIIKRHGGNIWAEGKIDKGATFFFSLPKNVKDKENNANI